MLNLGKIKKHNKNSNGTFIWHACVDCGKQRWVAYRVGTKTPVRPRCCRCANKLKIRYGSANNLWRGGVSHNGEYVLIRIHPSDFFCPMANKRHYIPEHRLIMAKHLGRNLHAWEIVHHRNGVKYDNRIENLQLVSDDRHKQITRLETEIKRLKVENRALRKRLREDSHV